MAVKQALGVKAPDGSDYVTLTDGAGNLSPAGSAATAGDVASGATDSGNPVKVAGVYKSTLDTYTNGQRAQWAMDTRGAGHVAIFNTDGNVGATVGAFGNSDALSATSQALGVGNFALGFNGTTWDRNRSGDVNNVAAATGYLNNLVVGRYNAAPPTLTDTRYNALQVDARGNLKTTLSDKDGNSNLFTTTQADAQSNVVTTLDTTSYNSVFNGTTWDRLRSGTTTGTLLATEAPATSGGLSTTYLSCANSNNATSVKASAGQLYKVVVFNNSSTVAYLKFYNKASAPAPASDTVVHKIMIPATSGVEEFWPMGFPFSTGIAFATVTGFSDTDNTSVAASAYSVTLGYK